MVALAVVAVVATGSARQTGQEPSARVGAGLAATAVTMPQAVPAVPTSRLAQPEPTGAAALPQVAVSRQAAEEIGRFRARAFGEDNPVLIEAQRKIYPEGGPIDGPVDKVVPDGARVWLIRVKGIFVPPKYPARYVPAPTKGWLYTIVEVETGRTFGSGIRADGVPVR